MAVRVSVACGEAFTLFVDNSGNVFACGDGRRGQLGNPEFKYCLHQPMKIPFLKEIVEVSCGRKFSLCLDVSGFVWSFGDNYFGQLGLGDDQRRKTPVLIEGIDNIISISCGGTHSFCISSSSDIFGFGKNEEGQLGLGDELNRSIPEKISRIPGTVVSIAAGDYHSVFLSQEGEVFVCGSDCGTGNLGLGEGIHEKQVRIVQIQNIQSIISISCGAQHTLLLSKEGYVFGFGINSQGQIDKDAVSKYVPSKLENIDLIKKLSCGLTFSLLIDENNRIIMLGKFLKEFGFSPSPIIPKVIDNPSEMEEISRIACGGSHSVLRCTSNIFVNGKNDKGQLGIDSDKDRRDDLQKYVPANNIQSILGPILSSQSRIKSARK